MKTNQIMQLDFNGKTLAIEHKTQMGSLTELWSIGNGIRKSKGLPEMNMSNYMHSFETLELVQAIEKSRGFKTVDTSYLENSKGMLAETIKTDLIRTKRGRHGGGTWAHLYLLLDAASKLDADFKVMIYDILIEGKLLEWRDDSGDSFKALNIVLDATVVAKTGARPSVALYKRVARYIKDKIQPTGGEWNTATYDELKRRTAIETQVMIILKLNFINSEPELARAIADM